MITENNKTILLVEDDLIVAETEKNMLEHYNYNVITVNTPEKAIESALSNKNIDLILMDIDLGSEIDGTKVAEIILEKKDIPIVFLSCHSETHIVEKTEKITSYGYIIKGSNITVIDASIKMAFKLFETKKTLSDELSIRKKIENNLKLSEEKFKNIVDASPTAMYFYKLDNNDNLIFMGSNPSADKITGINNNNLRGKKIEEAFPNLKNTFVPDLFKKVAKRELGYQNFEIPYSDNRFSGYYNVHVFLTQENMIAVDFIDITEKKENLEKLNHAVKKYQLLFENLTVGFALHEMIYDEAGNPADYIFIEVNPAYEKLTGLKSEDIIGKRVKEILPNTEKYWIETFGDVAKTGISNYFENYSSEFEKYYSVTAFSPEKDKFAVIISDITHRKQSEKLIKNKNKELEQIIYVASHDLRSPLVNVDGYSKELEYSIEEIQNLLKDSNITLEELKKKFSYELEDMLSSLNYIRTSTKQMDSLLMGLLKLSRIGKASLDIKILDMNNLLNKVKQNFEFQSKNTNSKIIIDNLPPCKSDSILLIQVFTNLIDNSIKYSKPNIPPIIHINGEIKNNRSIYRIMDNGIGISNDQKEIIFELFHRLNPGSKTGEGLGLTIVKNILTKLNGHIEIESKLGEGACFILYLPYSKKKFKE